MKINYANNPLLGTGKWDPLLSLLTPGGDSIVVPAELFYAIKTRARNLSNKGIGFFQSSQRNNVYTISRTNKCICKGGYKSDFTIELEKMKVGAVMEVPESKRENLRNSSHSLKKKGFGEYRTYREAGKIKVVRTK